MEQLDATPAGSSPAADVPASVVEQAVAAGDQALYREARRAERVGTPLAPSTPDSAPAQPAEQDASTEASTDPASEAGKPRKKNAETRIQELLKERAEERKARERLEQRLAELERSSQPKSDPQPASAPAAAERFPSFDDYVKANPDASYEDYLDARADWRADQRIQQREAEAEAKRARERASQTEQELTTKYRAQIDAAIKEDPDFLDGISAEVLALRPFSAIRDAQGRWTEQPTGYHALGQEIFASSMAPRLMRHFSDHPEDFHRIASLQPSQLLKEMGKLEDRLTAKPAAAAPPPKTVSDAPPPPTVLGSRPVSTTDPLEAAVASGDVRAYRDARLRQRTAYQR